MWDVQNSNTTAEWLGTCMDISESKIVVQFEPRRAFDTNRRLKRLNRGRLNGLRRGLSLGSLWLNDDKSRKLGYAKLFH